jgi:hypothetical protein
MKYLLPFLLLLTSCASIKPLPNYSKGQRETIRYWQPAPAPATYLIPAAAAPAPVYEAMPDSLPFVKVPRPPNYEIEGAKRGFLRRRFLPGAAKVQQSRALPTQH